MPETNLRIKQYRGKAGLASIRDEWETLTISMPERRYFHLYEWYLSYINTLEENPDEVYFYVIYEGSNPIAIFPLKCTIRKTCGWKFRVVEIPTHPHIDLSDIICADSNYYQSALTILLGYLRKKQKPTWDYVSFSRLLEDSPVLVKKRSLKIMSICEEIGRCDYIPLSGAKVVRDRISKNFRGNLRKARNKLQRMGELRFESHWQGEQLWKAFSEFLRVEASGWKGDKGTGTAIKQSEKIEKFYRTWINHIGPVGGCAINTLRVNNECVAAQVCYVFGGIVYVSKIGYDDRYIKAGPGNVAMEYMIDQFAKDQNVKEINFVTGATWHKDWRPNHYKVYRVSIFNYSLAGIIALILIGVRKGARWFRNV